MFSYKTKPVQHRLDNAIAQDRRAINEQWKIEAREFFNLVKRARREFDNIAFNDWLFAVGMYGPLHDRLKIAKLLFDETTLEQDG